MFDKYDSNYDNYIIIITIIQTFWILEGTVDVILSFREKCTIHSSTTFLQLLKNE